VAWSSSGGITIHLVFSQSSGREEDGLGEMNAKKRRTLSRRAWMAWGKPIDVFLLWFDWTCVPIANALGFASRRLTLSYFWPTLGIVNRGRMRKRFSTRGRCSPCTGAGCRRCAGCAVETGWGSRHLVGPNASRDGNIGFLRARRRGRRISCRRWDT
jgi:hypothetical protein